MNRAGEGGALEAAETRSSDESEFDLPFFGENDLELEFLDMERCEDGTMLEKRDEHRDGVGDRMYSDIDRSFDGDGDAKCMNVALDVESGYMMDKVSEIDDSGSSVNSEGFVSVAGVLKTLFFILVWYTFSTLLTLYNKSLLGDDMGRFPAPLLMNTVHFMMQAVLSNVITCLWPQRFTSSKPMSWKDYSWRVIPTALGTALDINLSNASLVFISVTFATMCKSASPIFLLLFAFGFRLESPSFKLLGIVLIISTGILLTVAKDTEFDPWGFIFVMLAAVMSGFRWATTQILLQKEAYGLKNPLTLMSYVTPIMAASTLLLSFVFDPWRDFQINSYFSSSWHVARSCLLMLLGGTLAFFMVLTEYILVSVTSAVTVTIAGVVKEAVTILVAVLYFHDNFTLLKGTGLLIIMIGVGLFNLYKYQKLHGATSMCDEKVNSSAAKYVILDKLEDEEDGQN